MTSHSFSVSFYTLTINILWLKEAARFLAVELTGLEKIIRNTWVVSMGQLFQSDANVCWCPQRNWNPDFTLVSLPVSTLSSILLVHWPDHQDHLLLGGHCRTQLWAADFPAVLPSTNSASQPRCQEDRFLIIASTEFRCTVQPAAQLHFTLWMRHASHDAREHSLLTFSLNLFHKIFWEETQRLTSERQRAREGFLEFLNYSNGLLYDVHL